ncbi:unnamed protein product [Paramecium sonneborni]|uniref:Uncharacterized protein n=1 Tax=Paramecium sonneborni TaxID=65129 RepID=A0A8S1MXB0_9CILI|nr:unnamed protein product [Paramecium sonneborni]
MKTRENKKINNQKLVEKKIKKEVGKPVGLYKINLNPPDIWTSKIKEVQLISYFVNLGRHVCLHQAIFFKDLKKVEQNSLKRQEILNNLINQKKLYEKLELIARHLFEWICQKRNVVYFFRNYHDDKPKSKHANFNNKEWNYILKNVKFLFNDKFYQELLLILEQFEKNATEEEIGNLLISKSKTGQLSEVPQFIQNFFLILIKENIVSFQLCQITVQFLEQLKILFYQSIEQQKTLLYQLIGNLRYIMSLVVQEEIYSDTSQQDIDWNNEIFFHSTSN